MRRALIALGLLVAPTALPQARGDGPTLPTPPRQAEPWTPPATKLPRFLARATATLCEQGLADPRGCAYRRVRIKVGVVWGGAQEVEVGGWVLPPADGGPPRHAIAWDGLVYPLAADVGPAGLATDVRAIIEAPGPRGARGGLRAADEASAVAGLTFDPVQVCLLLRLGRAGLAEMLWASADDRPPSARGAGPGAKVDLTSYGVSYLTLAGDLAWRHFDRAVCAHMRGDDDLALADARFLAAFGPAVERQAEAMGFERPQVMGMGIGMARRDRPAPYLDFLGQVPALLADQERRARERAEAPAAPPGDGPEARVAALIRDLDQVAARQVSQPGGVFLGESPVIRELIALGDVAVEPLIRDLRADTRLTRSVGFGRDFHRGRTILGADRAAHAALVGILKVTTFAPPAANDDDAPRSRAAVADEIQAYWEKYRATPLVERWYRTLADDRAGPRAWLEAAGNIAQPENVRTVPGGDPLAMTETTALKPGERPKLRGEPLRAGHAPTVAELMARRVRSMGKLPSGRNPDLGDACRMATILDEWDPAAAAPTLRDLMQACRTRYAEPTFGRDSSSQDLAVAIARFTLARDRAGDAEAVREYAEWVKTIEPERLDHRALAALEPLYRKPDDPALAAAAACLFGDPKSPWVPLIGRPGSPPTYHLAELIASPLARVPAFRAMLREALDDRTPAGEATPGASGTVSVRLDGGFSMGASPPANHRADPAPGAAVPIRRCDFYAWRLATLDGAPAFNPCWPPAERDAALAAMAAFLKDGK